MGLRENLRDALPDDQFNADALIARARRGPAQPPARRQWAAIGGALLLAIAAVATLVTVRSTHATTPAHAPATASASPQPAAPLNNSFAGFLDYQFPAAESGWLHLFTPKGTTLVYHTADGGHHWAEQLREEGLGGPARLQAIDARQAVLVVNVNIAGTTPGPVRVYSTSDAGLNWHETDGPRASLAASFFSSATEGWIATAAPAVAGSGYTPYASRVTLYHTSDGGAHWDTLNGTGGLTGDDNKGTLYFIDSKIGRLTSFGSLSGQSSRLYSTRDGGRSWQAQEFPGATRVSLPRFFNPAEGVLVTDKGVYRSRDGGATWTKALDGLQPVYFVDADHWLRIQVQGIETSSGGVTWSQPRRWKPPLPAGWSQSTLTFVPPSIALLAITDTTTRLVSLYGAGVVGESYNVTITGRVPHYAVVRTDNGGVSWEQVVLPVL
jgi:photosystem II stability/assembly factor-like uncharacterized protein